MNDTVLVLIVGMLFGASLDMAGFGSARKLNHQFSGKDFTMFKVMFGAILVAAAVYALALDLGAAAVDDRLIPTLNPAVIAGGFFLGAALVIGGYCPGTAVAASANGKIDAVIFLVGNFAGYCLWTGGAANFNAEKIYAPLMTEHMILSELAGVQKIWILTALLVVLAAGWKIGDRIERAKAKRLINPKTIL